MKFNPQKFYLVLFFIISAVFSIKSQNTAIDSLNQLLSTSKEDTAKVDILYKLALQYINSDPAIYKECTDKSYALALKLNYKRGIGRNLNSLGNLARLQENYAKAISLFERSMKIAKEIKDTATIANCFNGLGIIDANQGAYDKAINYYKQCLAMQKAIKDTRGDATIYNNIGNVYKNKGNYDQALLYYIQALKIMEKLNDLDRVPVMLLNIGNIYALQKDYSMAIDYYLQSLNNNKNKEVIATAYSNIGQAYAKMNMFDKADDYLKRALKLSQKENYKKRIAETLANMGFNYMSAGKLEKALEYYLESLQISKELNGKKLISETTNNIALAYLQQKDYKKSLEYGEKGLALAQEIGAKEMIMNSYESLSETNKKMNNYEKALEYYKLSVALKDSIFSKEKAQAMAELQTRYETEKREKEIVLLTKDNELKEKEFKQQKIIRSSLIGGLILLFILSLTLYNRFRFKQKANLLLEDQKKEIQQKNNQITDSIEYAKTIQEAILPSVKTVETFFPDSFILYKPKAIVSGDFYWIGKENNKIICAVADCTGHGVPGAFMSLLGNNLLENVINKTNTLNPAAILDTLNEEIVNVMAQGEEGASIKNGMDIALIIIDKANQKLEYAGAHNPLYLLRNEKILEIKADRMPVGFLNKNAPVKFTNHTQELKKDDIVYLFSDGFADQLGGPDRKKFFYQPFRDLLFSIHKFPMQEQKLKLEESLTAWKGEREQTDDILVMGIRC